MQTLKSNLLHLDGSARCVERIRVARQLAETFDAKVTGLYGVTPSRTRYSIAAPDSSVIAGDFVTVDQEERDRAHAVFAAESAGAPLPSWSELEDCTPRGFAWHTIYSDLMLLGQRDSNGSAFDETPSDFLPSLLIETGRPALVLPHTGTIAPIGRTVLVAWKQTRESARAVSAALPWLCRAEHVHVMAFGYDPDPALQALQDYLLCHGVITTLHRGAPQEEGVGERLLSKASNLGADLLVMGCYGRSRSREWIFGGATRTVLETMTLPVLMAH